ncbi:MAG: hypothetical protein Q8O40_10110 [Chloroflexota bacterium]|nr:hypothetical protein [Chloroflexota bacterium]
MCEEAYRSGHDLSLYRKIISRHRNSGGLGSLLDDDSFHKSIWDTLEAWNMAQRGAQLTSPPNLRRSILDHRPQLVDLYGYKLESLTEKESSGTVLPLLQNVFLGLRVMESKRRIVGVSKTLHFLLPDLVMPVDGTYTLPYFYGYNKYDRTPSAEFATFKGIFKGTHRIAEKLRLTPTDVSGDGWCTAVPKLIDNAIIGLFKHFERSATT